jgi:NADH dehydrogenase
MSAKASELKGKTAAVTGASGFLGQHLCEALEKTGSVVRRLSRKAEEGCDAVKFDGGDSLVRAFDGADVVYHVAGRTNGLSEQLREANLTTTEFAVAAAKKSGVKRLIFVSSAAAAMRKGEYGNLKFEAEKLVAASGIEHLIFRPTLIYGPGDDKNVAMMARVIKRYPVVPVLGGGHFKIQPVYIADAVSVLVQALDKRVPLTVYNIAGPAQITLRDMLLLISEHMRRRRIFVPVPLKPIQAGLRIYQKIFPSTRLPAKQVLELDKHEAFDISLTRRDFDFSPRTFEDGIRLTVAKEGW